MNETDKKIKYGDLSIPIQVAIVSSYVVGIIYLISVILVLRGG